jgi:hypothetical protein
METIDRRSAVRAILRGAAIGTGGFRVDTERGRGGAARAGKESRRDSW